MCQTSTLSRMRVSLRVVISTLAVLQQLMIPGHGSQNYFEALKEGEINSGEDDLTLNEDIFKCNIDKACHFIMKDNSSRYLLSNYGAKVKDGFVGEIVWMKIAAKTFKIRHITGKCVGLRVSDYAIVFTSSCNESFIWTDNSCIQHVRTGLCMIADGNYNGAVVRLRDKCHDEFSRYKQSDKLSLENMATKKCFHPSNGGYIAPQDGLELVFHYGCNLDRLRFDLIWD